MNASCESATVLRTGVWMLTPLPREGAIGLDLVGRLQPPVHAVPCERVGQRRQSRQATGESARQLKICRIPMNERPNRIRTRFGRPEFAVS